MPAEGKKEKKRKSKDAEDRPKKSSGAAMCADKRREKFGSGASGVKKYKDAQAAARRHAASSYKENLGRAIALARDASQVELGRCAFFLMLFPDFRPR